MDPTLLTTPDSGFIIVVHEALCNAYMEAKEGYFLLEQFHQGPSWVGTTLELTKLLQEIQHWRG